MISVYVYLAIEGIYGFVYLMTHGGIVVPLCRCFAGARWPPRIGSRFSQKTRACISVPKLVLFLYKLVALVSISGSISRVTVSVSVSRTDDAAVPVVAPVVARRRESCGRDHKATHARRWRLGLLPVPLRRTTGGGIPASALHGCRVLAAAGPSGPPTPRGFVEHRPPPL